jgi:hypothetical protein
MIFQIEIILKIAGLFEVYLATLSARPVCKGLVLPTVSTGITMKKQYFTIGLFAPEMRSSW